MGNLINLCIFGQHLFQKKIRKQKPHSLTMKDISTLLISTGSQYIYCHIRFPLIQNLKIYLQNSQ